jgi:hypothetical protein
MQGRELELFNKVEPYIVYPFQNGRGIRSDSPTEIIEAYEELQKLSKEDNKKAKNRLTPLGGFLMP